MALTYDQLKTALQEYTQNAETTFVTNLPNFIRSAEEKIFYTVDLTIFRRNVTGTCAANSQFLSKPSGYLAPFSAFVKLSSTNKQFLMIKETNFVQEFLEVNITGAPKFYAPYDATSFIIAPLPDDNYEIELHYYYKPASLTEGSGSGTTWLSENAPSCLLYASLIEAYGFMKGEPDVLQYYQQQFEFFLSRLKDLAEAREDTDSYRVGLPTSQRT